MVDRPKKELSSVQSVDMNSNIREASRSAHYNHVINGRAKYQREIIMEFMERHQLPRNRREIALITGIPINAVTGRVNALLENGELIEEHFATDPVTGQRVGYVEVPYTVIQSRMF